MIRGIVLPKEAIIHRQIITHLRSLGAWVFKVHGSPYQTVGVPDLLVSYRGRFYAMEVKQPGKQLSLIQAKTIEAIRATGSVAGRVESVEDAVALLGEYAPE